MESQKEEIIIYADSLYSSIVGQEQNRFLSP
jgi:hypothetical protein